MPDENRPTGGRDTDEQSHRAEKGEGEEEDDGFTEPTPPGGGEKPMTTPPEEP
jgi:hypothetical protein